MFCDGELCVLHTKCPVVTRLYMGAAEAATNHREAFTTWRERPAEFNFDGRYPLLEVFDRAAEAWKGKLCAAHVYKSSFLA